MTRLGVTLYSMTNEWLARRFTLEQLLATVAELDLGPGVEMVGFQSLRGFPHVDVRRLPESGTRRPRTNPVRWRVSGGSSGARRRGASPRADGVSRLLESGEDLAGDALAGLDRSVEIALEID